MKQNLQAFKTGLTLDPLCSPSLRVAHSRAFLIGRPTIAVRAAANPRHPAMTSVSGCRCLLCLLLLLALIANSSRLTTSALQLPNRLSHVVWNVFLLFIILLNPGRQIGPIGPCYLVSHKPKHHRPPNPLCCPSEHLLTGPEPSNSTRRPDPSHRQEPLGA